MRISLSIPWAIVVAAAVLVLVAPGAARAPFTTDGYLYTQETLSKMRAHRVSRMTDEQIREARSAAEREFEVAKVRAQQEADERVKSYWEQQRLCSDIAYKTRYPERCSMPLNWLRIGEPTIEVTIEQLFTLHILGVCGHVGSVVEAREKDCLP